MSYRIEIAGSDTAFDCAIGQSVLDAALRAGIGLPYSCRKGVCGNCAGEIADGKIEPFAALSLRNDMCLPEQVLYCGCTPVSNLCIRPTDWRRIDLSLRKVFTSKVYSNELVAPDVSLLRLRLPAGQRAKFQAGQYLQIRLDDGSTRCYSMANPPQENDGVTLHIRHVPDGLFSGRVADLKAGDLLTIELPFGHVNLPQDDLRPIVFVASGTGFAPVKSILDDMAKRKIQRDITLIWGARQESGLYLRAAVEKWLRQWPTLRYIPALSGIPSELVPNAFDGRVSEALQTHCSDLTGCVVYVCGSPKTVESVRSAALQANAALADIHSDVFVTGP